MMVLQWRWIIASASVLAMSHAFVPIVRGFSLSNVHVMPSSSSSLNLIDEDADLMAEAVNRPVEAVTHPFRFHERLVNKLYLAADRDGDGYVSPVEAYAMILRLYVQLNRQAPIPPPSSSTIRKLFAESDVNKDGRVSRTEFNQLASVILRRATSRLVAHKLVTLIGAPLLAAKLVKVLKGKEWLPSMVARVVPTKLLPVVTNPTFVRTFLLVGLVASLGNIVLGLVNWILDRGLQLENDEVAAAPASPDNNEGTAKTETS